MTIPDLDRAALQGIADAGIDFQGVDEGRLVARARVTPADRDWLAGRGLRVVPEPRTLRPEGFDPAYQTYDSLLRDMRALAAVHPDICTLADLGPTWETTRGMASRRVWGLHIKKGDAAAKPGVVFVAAQHAREIVTPEIALAVARMLVGGYGTDPALTVRAVSWPLAAALGGDLALRRA